MDNLGNDINNILLTGSNGLLGSEIKKLTHSVNKNFFFTSRSSNNVDIKCDLTLMEDVIRLKKFVNPDLIIHSAAFVPQNDKQYNDALGNKNNLKMLKNLLNVFSSKIIFLSSMTVYGKSSWANAKETDVLDPKTHYAKGKMQAEKLLSKSRNSTLSIRIPGLYNKSRKNGLVYNLIHSVKHGREIHLPKNPIAWAGMDAHDASKIILEFCLMNWNGSLILNLGYDFSYSIDKLVNIVSDNFNKKIINKVNHPTFRFDLNKLKSFGVEPPKSFESSINKMCEQIN